MLLKKHHKWSSRHTYPFHLSLNNYWWRNYLDIVYLLDQDYTLNLFPSHVLWFGCTINSLWSCMGNTYFLKADTEHSLIILGVPCNGYHMKQPESCCFSLLKLELPHSNYHFNRNHSNFYIPWKTACDLVTSIPSRSEILDCIINYAHQYCKC